MERIVSALTEKNEKLNKVVKELKLKLASEKTEKEKLSREVSALKETLKVLLLTLCLLDLMFMMYFILDGFF